jgi:hypothetical protein
MLGLVVALTLAQPRAACAPGQAIGPDTAGHCCWRNQAWSKSQSRCVGVPTCPEGQVVLGESCGCPAGQATNADTAGHCCWAGQAWSQGRAVCVGVPSCPATLVQSGEACVDPMSVAPPPVDAAPPPPVEAPAPPPPMVQSEVDCPGVRVQGLCCAVGQNVVGGRCVDPLYCPPGTEAAGDQCVAVAAPQQLPTQPPPEQQTQYQPQQQPPPQQRQPLQQPPPQQGRSRAQPQPQPVQTYDAPVVANPRVQAPAAATEPDRYVNLDHVFVSAAGAFDFSELIYGGQTILDFVFVRGRRASFGLSLGAGVMTATSKLVVYLPAYLQVGIRLGSGLSELVLRVGGAAAMVSKYNSEGWMAKFVGGAGFVFRWGNGGVIFGLDLYINDHIAHAATVGFIF